MPKKFGGHLGETPREVQNEKGQKFRFVFAALAPVVLSDIPNFEHLPDNTTTNEPVANSSETQPVAEEVGWEGMYIQVDGEPAVTALVAGPSGSATSAESETETRATSSNVEMIDLMSEDNGDDVSSGVGNGEANVESDGEDDSGKVDEVSKRTRDLRGR